MLSTQFNCPCLTCTFPQFFAVICIYSSTKRKDEPEVIFEARQRSTSDHFRRKSISLFSKTRRCLSHSRRGTSPKTRVYAEKLKRFKLRSKRLSHAHIRTTHIRGQACHEEKLAIEVVPRRLRNDDRINPIRDRTRAKASDDWTPLIQDRALLLVFQEAVCRPRPRDGRQLA